MTSSAPPAPARDTARTLGCWLAAAAFTFTRIGHFRSAEAFLAQVPPPATESRCRGRGVGCTG